MGYSPRAIVGVCHVRADSGGLEPDADKGTWTQVGGTGKFARKNGSGGWWQGVMAEGKVSTGVWGGNCK